ncbi:MAG: LytTR family DNA-binding domain-containing protein [Oscillospiraceae bacterium]
MRIAICDDNSCELEKVSEILNSYRIEKNVGLVFQAFPDALSLLDALKNSQFDILLLDVLMPMLTGMQLAHEIRDFGNSARIIFLTSSPEFALESYSVNAYTYLLKPVAEKDIFPILDKIFAEEERCGETLAIKLQNSIISIPFSTLAFVEVLNKTLHFYLTDGTLRELDAPLSAYEETLLTSPDFLKVHRSFIVNIWQIKELLPTKLITFAGKVVPISRRLYPFVRETYMAHLFSQDEDFAKE